MENSTSEHAQSSPATVVHGLDGMRTLVGTTIGPSRPLTIDQPRIDAFGDITEDRQWIHVDVERSTNGPFGTTIGHGYLTLSLCAHFMQQLLDVRDISMAVNYGLDRVRFPSPVPVGSALSAEAELLEVTDVPGGLQSKFRLTVVRSGSEKPVCVADVLVRYYS